MLLAIVAACLVAFFAISGSSTTETTTTPKTATVKTCKQQDPHLGPRMGECIAQHFGFELGVPIPRPGIPTLSYGDQCIDISQWNGSYPNLAGIKCVIIQSNYGLHVEPSVYSQAKDAREHGIPFGFYTYMEGASGSQEAELARNTTRNLGGTLGLWGDAEINAAYAHACAYASKAVQYGIGGIYSSPGLLPSWVHCAGKLWGAEWGTSHYTFNGYPSLAIWQWCGTCFFHGVETDRDQALNLTPAPKPKPKPTKHQQLHKLLVRDRELYRDLKRHQCFTVHGKDAYALCPHWGKEWRETKAAIVKLRKEGAS